MYRYPFSQLFYNSLAFSRALGGVIYQVCVLYKHYFFVKTTWVIMDNIDRRAELPFFNFYVNVEKKGVREIAVPGPTKGVIERRSH